MCVCGVGSGIILCHFPILALTLTEMKNVNIRI